MSNERLPASVEAAGLVRRAQGDGDFATIVKKGDPDRGAILLLVSSRGRHVACLERMPTLDGYQWASVGPSESAVPTKSATSSQSAPGSTRICGRLNWISRTRNDSS